jgi:hypothetical protein
MTTAVLPSFATVRPPSMKWAKITLTATWWPQEDSKPHSRCMGYGASLRWGNSSRVLYTTTPGPTPTGPEPFRQLPKLGASGHLKGTVRRGKVVANRLPAAPWRAPRSGQNMSRASRFRTKHATAQRVTLLLMRCGRARRPQRGKGGGEGASAGPKFEVH